MSTPVFRWYVLGALNLLLSNTAHESFLRAFWGALGCACFAIGAGISYALWRMR